MYVIKKTICKIAIPFSTKCTHQRQWYFLKSEDNENVLKVLIAFYCQISPMKITSNGHCCDLSYDLIMPCSSPRYFYIRDRGKSQSMDRDRGRERIHSNETVKHGNKTCKYLPKMNLTLSRSTSIELLDSNYKPKLTVLDELQNEYEEEELNISQKLNEKNSKLFLTMIKNKLNSVNYLQEQIDNDIKLIKQKEQGKILCSLHVIS